MTYIRKYNERLEDLRGICQGCHNFTHGKSDVDPAAYTPPRILTGREVKSVYLAGTCGMGDGDEGLNWRHEITKSYFFPEKESAPDVPVVGGVDVPMVGRIDYCGPFFSYQHNCINSALNGDHGQEFLGERRDIFVRSMNAIDRADFVFAWIDRLDCYGTMAEVGYAYSTKGRHSVLIGRPKTLDELWFVYEMGVGIVPRPGELLTPKAAFDWAFSCDARSGFSESK